MSPAIEKKLNDLGIFHYWQLAELKPAAAEKIGEEVGLPGRVEGWIAQGQDDRRAKRNNSRQRASSNGSARPCISRRQSG